MFKDVARCSSPRQPDNKFTFLVLHGPSSWRSSSGSRASRHPRCAFGCGMQREGPTGRMLAGGRPLGFKSCGRSAALAQRLGLSLPMNQGGSLRRPGFAVCCRWALVPSSRTPASGTGRHGCCIGPLIMECEIHVLEISRGTIYNKTIFSVLFARRCCALLMANSQWREPA
jgi:hypothetical protein